MLIRLDGEIVFDKHSRGEMTFETTIYFIVFALESCIMVKVRSAVICVKILVGPWALIPGSKIWQKV